MAPKVLTQSTFEGQVKAGIVLVDFWAPWCGPCRAFGPIFDKAADANPDIVFAKVNTEDEPDLAIELGIQAIPTLMAYRDGVLVFEQAGALSAPALQNLIGTIRGLDMDRVRSEIRAHAAAS